MTPPIEEIARGLTGGAEWISAFLRRLHPTTTVLDVGVLHHADLGQVPAVRTVNSVYGQEWVWAFTGRRMRKGKPVGPPIFVDNNFPDSSYRALRTHLQSRQP